jgi:hypothetical protein
MRHNRLYNQLAGGHSLRKGFSEQSSQYRAVIKNRQALRERDMARFEVRALERDKKLIREIAKRLAADDKAAQELRAELAKQTPDDDEPGAFWRQLRASPLVGSGIKIRRDKVRLRKIL